MLRHRGWLSGKMSPHVTLVREFFNSKPSLPNSNTLVKFLIRAGYSAPRARPKP
jgi:hypothetical protein